MATTEELSAKTADFYLSGRENRYSGDKLKTILSYHRRGSKPSKVSSTWFNNFKKYVISEGSRGKDSFGLKAAGESVAGNWDDDKLRAFIRASGIQDELSEGGVNTNYQSAPREILLMTIGSLLNTDRNGGWSTHDIGGENWQKSEIDNWSNGFDQHYQLVTNLLEKGGTYDQVQGVIDSTDGSPSSYASLLNEIKDLEGTDWQNYINENFADEGILPNGTFGGYTIPTNTTSVVNAATPTETVNQQITEAVVGDSSLDALRKEEGFREENGKYFVGDQEYAYDEENNQVVYVGGENDSQRWTPEGSGMASQYQELTEQEKQTIAQQQGIVDKIVGTDEIDPKTGEKVTPGLVNEYGQFVDSTISELETREKTGTDFASQINNELTNFLNGYTDVDGNQVKGFLDYQSDLEGAADTYKTDMTTLSGLYDQAYAGFESDLSPLRGEMTQVRDRLGDVSTAQMGVAKDAGSSDYYTRLSGLLYDDARDEINRGTAGARDSLNTMYASAGLDPSSPAYTAAMRDLAQSRSDALVKSRRQAILDSYGIGTDMLTNRSNALAGAGNALSNQLSGIGTEMNALDSLYGVKLGGLNTRRDMIGQIYGANKDIADIGVRGLNTVLDNKFKGLQAKEDQFNKKINLTDSLYKNQAGMYGTAYDALGGMRGIYDKEGGDRFNTLTEFNLGQGSNKLTLETLRQYASENPNYTIDPDLEKFLSGGK